MPYFKVTAMDKSGKTAANIMEAESRAALSKLLTKDGLFLIDAVPTAAPPKKEETGKPVAVKTEADIQAEAAAKTKKKRKKSVPVLVVSAFTNQLALMIKASLPALQAISTLTLQQKDPVFITTLFDIQERLKRGEYLSRAFSQHPEVFSPIYINLLAAGEASGQLPVMLNRIAEYLEFQTDIQRKMRSAMIYPLLVLFAAVSVILFLMLFVLPNFVDIFAQFNAPLPLPTQILLNMSTALREYWYVFALLIGGAAYFIRGWLAQPENRATVDIYALKIPILGAMFETLVITRMLRILEVLLTAKVPILKALELAKASANQIYYERLIDKVMKNVSEGKGIASGLYGDPHFPGSLADMISTAERTGGLPEILRLSAADYQKNLDGKINDSFAAMEPIFIGGLSLIVGTIAIAILLPIMSLGTIVE